MSTRKRSAKQANLTKNPKKAKKPKLVSNYPPKSDLDALIDQFIHQKKSYVNSFELLNFPSNHQNTTPLVHQELVKEYFSTHVVPLSKCPSCQTVSDEDHLMVYQNGFAYYFHFVCQNINCFNMLE